MSIGNQNPRASARGAVKTDREMLELAAKAAGRTIKGWWEKYPGEWWADIGASAPNAAPTVWNPLRDDGDALRLAIDTKVLFDIQSHIGRLLFEEGAQSDLHATTRRAIVRAAAAIGAGAKGVNSD